MRTALATLAFCIFMQAPLSAQADNGTLYLLSGFPFPYGPSSLPSIVYRVARQAQPQLVLIRELFPCKEGRRYEGAGTTSIHADYDRRMIVLGNISAYEIVDMDSPESAASFVIKEKGMSYIRSAFVDIPGRGLYYTVYLFGDTTAELRGVRLARPLNTTLTPVALPWSDYVQIRVGGTAGVAQATSDRVETSVGRAGTIRPLASVEPLKPVETGPAENGIPPNEAVRLEANNDALLAVSRASEHVQEPDGIGRTTIRVFLKKLKAWTSVVVPGSSSRIRAFGPWFASVATGPSYGTPSPGTDIRRAFRIWPQEDYTLEDFFEDNEQYRPGRLFLYNSLSGRSYTIETGQGDSEIVLVADNTVYYRVNSALYKATIGATAIGPRELVIDDPAVTLVHWAWLGPAPAKVQ